MLINPHFLTFIRLLNKNYRVPSPHVISNRLLDEEYAVAMSALKKELAKTHGVALTLDPWTCKAQSYPYLGMLTFLNIKMNLIKKIQTILLRFKKK